MKKIHFILIIITFVFFAQVLVFYRGIYIPSPMKTPDFLGINVNISVPLEMNDNFAQGN